jgi:hypothetical protein
MVKIYFKYKYFDQFFIPTWQPKIHSKELLITSELPHDSLEFLNGPIMWRHMAIII